MTPIKFLLFCSIFSMFANCEIEISPILYTCVNNIAYRLYSKTSVNCAELPQYIVESIYHRHLTQKKPFSLGVIFKDFHHDDGIRIPLQNKLNKTFDELHMKCGIISDSIDASEGYHPRFVDYVHCRTHTYHEDPELYCRPDKSTETRLKRSDFCIGSESLHDLGFKWDNSNHPFVDFWETKKVATAKTCSGYLENTFESWSKWFSQIEISKERRQERERVCNKKNKNDCCQLRQLP